MLAGWGAPASASAWLALALGALLLLARPLVPARLRRRWGAAPLALELTGAALLAALLSVLYVQHYLRGGPRIIDATSYYLEGKALAHGLLAFTPSLPSGAFRGRFLLSTPSEQLAVLFPPGYPALLALGFLVRAPLLVGPALAAALTVSTFALGRALGFGPRAALLAALVGALSATLRYHTADTMSHGLAALLLSLSLLGALGQRRWSALGGGLALGWLLATRPVTGGVVALGVLLVQRRHPGRLGLLALGSLPGLALLLLHQHAATGEWLGSTQLRYYALADGPPGCFRYGFGADIGCWFEHGDVLERHGAGHGPWQALRTTTSRLYVHLADVGNAPWLALLLPVALVVQWSSAGARLLGGLVLALIAAYVPFYFDGSYPGGGARFYSEALPLEHLLLAGLAVRWRREAWLPPLMLIGYALHASHTHTALQQRDGGRPMYEPEIVAAAGVRRGLLFVETDHGFALGHDPSVRDAATGLVVARRRYDAHDWVLWRRLGTPPSHQYHFDLQGLSAPSVERLSFPAELDRLRFEAEAEWPPLAVSGGWAHPQHLAPACVSRGAGLRLRATGSHDAARARLELAVARPGRYRLIAHWAAYGEPRASVGLHAGAASASLQAHDFARDPCPSLLAGEHDVQERLVVEAWATGDAVVLDALELLARPSAGP